MSTIPIVKGYPASLLVTLKNDGEIVDVNSGDWVITANLYYQTARGAEPFALTPAVAGQQVLIELTDEQTDTLNHLGLGYVLIVKALKTDDTVSVRAEIAVSVRNEL